MARRDLIDSCGVALAEHRLWLPSRTADFPRPKAIRDPVTVQEWRERYVLTPCWYCGGPTNERDPVRRGELHHLCRHDRPWAFFWVCANCHRHNGDAVKSASLARLLRLKHEKDRKSTNWVLLAIGLNRFLPDPDPPTPEARA